MSTPDTSDREEHEKLPEKPHQTIAWLASLAGRRSETEDSWNLIFKRIMLSCAPMAVPVLIVCAFATVVFCLKLDLVRWLSALAATFGISGIAVASAALRRRLGGDGSGVPPGETGPDGGPQAGIDAAQEDGQNGHSS